MVLLNHLKVLHDLIRIKILVLVPVLVPATRQVALRVCCVAVRVIFEERIPILSLVS
jgi:hypothetical protein